jgi:lipopolysaccharide transport system ATP-binding protein
VSEESFEPVEDKIVEIDVGANPELLGQYFVSCHVNDENGIVVAQCDSRNVGGWFDPATPQELTLTIRALWLKPGRYTVDVFVCKTGILDSWEGAAVFEVLPTSPYPELAGDEALRAGMVLSDYGYESRSSA